MILIFYSWTALNGASGSSVAMGITDDRGRAMRAGEECLGSGRAMVVIIDAVRPAMAPRTLAPCYVRTGVSWLGQRTGANSAIAQTAPGSNVRAQTKGIRVLSRAARPSGTRSVPSSSARAWRASRTSRSP